MSTIDFQAGDRIKVLFAGNAEHPEPVERIIYAAEFPDEPGVLYSYHPFDDTCPQVPLAELVQSDDLTLALDQSVNDALPTEPGEYEEVSRYISNKALEGTVFEDLLRENGEWHPDKPWILHENGEWEAPDGDRHPTSDSWHLAANAAEFVPWAERDQIELPNLDEDGEDSSFPLGF